MLLCTILEFAQIKMNLKSEIVQCLGKFSLFSSANKILSMKMIPSTFPAVHGIRTLSILWVIYGHVYTARRFPPMSNVLDLEVVSIKQ